MVKAKEALQEKVCIIRNVPMSLMSTGTPDQVKEYCKKLIDTAGKDGGYIMSAAAAMDDCKADNVRVMMGFAREYGLC
jgi:uroporphyrinogen-III decarboxylase